MRKVICTVCMLLCLLFFVPAVSAAEAEEISGEELVAAYRGAESVGRLFDGRFMESIRFRSGGYITLEHREGIGSLYILFDQEDCGYTVINEDTGERRTMEASGFLHVFLNLEELFGAPPACVTLIFEEEETKVCEIHAFSSGAVPDWVQQWTQPAEGESDLVLFSTHGDDEQLFFAGMLPYYAREKGYNVQVVYMTGHRNMSMRRSHEMLDGLWAVGIRNYPVFGPFGDYNSTSKAEAYQIYRNKNISKEDMLAFVVENVRRFRPKVAVGHDLLGEYGHGMHMVYAELLCEAVETSMDPSVFPASAQKYGVWDVPKTYLHLYENNQIWMNWDIPLESFDGMTAYEVTRFLGFPCHVSQQTYYSSYFAGKETAADITEDSPCEFGLYRSTVGEDLEKMDFFENVMTHTEDAILAANLEAEAEQLAEETVIQTEPLETEPVETAPQQEIPADAGEIAGIPVICTGMAAILIIILIGKVLKKKK